LKCRICKKEAINEKYCLLHEKAHQNLMENFEPWKKALDVSWEDYLKTMIKTPLAGIKAKEVAEVLLSETS
jgi:hypothetical protein